VRSTTRHRSDRCARGLPPSRSHRSGRDLYSTGRAIEKAEVLEENEKAAKEGKKPRPTLHAAWHHQASLSTIRSSPRPRSERTQRVRPKGDHGKRDGLRGWKENVIVRKPHPAGTGMAYHKVRKDQAAEPPMWTFGARRKCRRPRGRRQQEAPDQRAERRGLLSSENSSQGSRSSGRLGSWIVSRLQAHARSGPREG